MTRATTVEITEFRLVDGADDERLLEASAQIEDDLESFDGFVRRELLRGEDGVWVDLVWWSSRETAEAAVTAAMADESFGRYFSLIDDASIDMRHFETAASHAAT